MSKPHMLTIDGRGGWCCRCHPWWPAMLCSNWPREVLDFALIAQAASLEGRIPIMHFFDGFRTSHEMRKIAVINDDTLHGKIKDKWLAQHEVTQRYHFF